MMYVLETDSLKKRFFIAGVFWLKNGFLEANLQETLDFLKRTRNGVGCES